MVDHVALEPRISDLPQVPGTIEQSTSANGLNGTAIPQCIRRSGAAHHPSDDAAGAPSDHR
jgi:hypothetical protein